MIGMKAVLVTGGVGLVAVLGIAFMLVLEKGAHADTKGLLAGEKQLVADIQTQHATIAADRAVAVAENAQRMQSEIDAFLESEKILRRDLSTIEQQRQADRRDSDSRIARLKRENEETRAWADSLVPVDWVDFMREPIDEATAAATGSAGSPDG